MSDELEDPSSPEWIAREQPPGAAAGERHAPPDDDLEDPESAAWIAREQPPGERGDR